MGDTPQNRWNQRAPAVDSIELADAIARVVRAAERFVAAQDTLHHTIDFQELDAANATAQALRVAVYHLQTLRQTPAHHQNEENEENPNT